MRYVRNADGMALMLVIWVLAIFMVLAISFSYATKTEMSATLAFRDAAEERFLAEGSLERAFLELLLRRTVPVSNVEEEQPWRADGTEYRVDFDHGYGLVRITAEGGKIDINKAPELVLKNLLIALMAKGDDVDIIVDSIQDWRDADNLHRLHGAEDDYYLTLSVPYKAKNADFESIEELLLVRGVTPDILYGTASRAGLADFMTVYSENGKINVSAAPKEVLMGLPGMTAEMADIVIQFRQSREIKSIQEFREIVGDLFTPMSPYITAGSGTVFTVEAIGRKSEKKGGFAVKSVVSLAGIRPTFLYYRSPSDTGKWKKTESLPQ